MLHTHTHRYNSIRNNAPTSEQHLSKYLFKRTTTRRVEREKFVILNWMTVCVLPPPPFMPTFAFFIQSFFTGIDTHRLLYLLYLDSLCFDLWKSIFFVSHSILGVGVGCFGSQKDCLLKREVWVWPQRELFYQEDSRPTKDFFKLKNAGMRPLISLRSPSINRSTPPRKPHRIRYQNLLPDTLCLQSQLAVLTNDFN